MFGYKKRTRYRRGDVGTSQWIRARTGRKYSRTQKRLARLEKKAKAQELKTHDVAYNGAIATAGAIVYLSGVAQGDQSINREGLKIVGTRLYGKVLLTGNNAAAIASKVRIILFQDKDNQGALPAIAELLENATVYSLFAHEYRHRFRIMYDRSFTVGSVAETSDNNYQKLFNVNGRLPKRGLKMFYGGTGSSIADAEANALFMCIIATNVTDQPIVNSEFRLRFYG